MRTSITSLFLSAVLLALLPAPGWAEEEVGGGGGDMWRGLREWDGDGS